MIVKDYVRAPRALRGDVHEVDIRKLMICNIIPWETVLRGGPASERDLVFVSPVDYNALRIRCRCVAPLSPKESYESRCERHNGVAPEPGARACEQADRLEARPRTVD